MGGTVFGRDTVTYAPWEKEYAADGKVYVKAYCKVAATAKTPQFIIADEYGQCNIALPAAGKYGYLGVPIQSYDAGDLGTFQIGGKCESVITASLSMAVGHGLTVNTGAIADIGADYSGAAGEFGAAITETTTSTTQDIMLVPERIITI